MKTDFTLIISTLIVVIGWFVNSWLNRVHEISKKRMDYRLETLKSFSASLFIDCNITATVH